MSEDIDMSRPGYELFPETAQPYQAQGVTDQVAGVQTNSYAGVEGVAAGQQHVESDKELNFRALREEIAKAQAEREYWKGMAEGRSRQPEVAEPSKPKHDPLAPIKSFEEHDWELGKNVKTAFEIQQQQLQDLRSEIADRLAAIDAKTRFADWKDSVTQHVPQLTKENSLYSEMIERCSNPYEAAYLLSQLRAKGEAAASQGQPPMQHAAPHYGDRAVHNAMKPGNVATVGGRGTLSQAEMYASMSDKDFMALAARHMEMI